jgi:hypothetical protein
MQLETWAPQEAEVLQTKDGSYMQVWFNGYPYVVRWLIEVCVLAYLHKVSVDLIGKKALPASSFLYINS